MQNNDKRPFEYLDSRSFRDKLRPISWFPTLIVTLSLVAFQRWSANILQGLLVGCFEEHGRSLVTLTASECFTPSQGTQAPVIPCFKSGETPWSWSDKIVPSWFAVQQELISHHRANRVCSTVGRSGGALSVAPVAGHWIRTAHIEWLIVQVLFISRVAAISIPRASARDQKCCYDECSKIN